MLARMFALGSRAILSSPAEPLHQARPNLLSPVTQFFIGTFFQRNYSIGALHNGIIETGSYSINPLEGRIEKLDLYKTSTEEFSTKNNSLPSEGPIMSREEYQKTLRTFQEYISDYISTLSENERKSQSELMLKSYECYVTLSYNSYKEKFFPSPNPYII